MQSIAQTPSRESLRSYAERAKQMKGFTLELRPTRIGLPLPWNYVGRARECLSSANSVLDVGTGGGEVFSEILTGKPSTLSVTATEPWLPNFEVAKERLRPYAANVVYTTSLSLPFEDAAFDLILDRHEELNPAEMARVLAPGGGIVTQQCNSDFWKELSESFPRRTVFKPHFELYQQGFRDAGLQVQRAELHHTQVAFAELGEIVYSLTALPWDVPEFDLDRDFEALIKLERALRRPEGIVLSEAYYIIEAQKLA